MLIENGSTPTISFLMVDATDRSTAEAGLDPVPVVYLSANGATFAASTNAASAVAGRDGWYKVVLTALETGEDGELIVEATGTGAATWREKHQVYTSLTAVLASGETVDLASGEHEAIADTTLRRNTTNIEASSDGDALSVASLYGLMQKFFEAAITGATVTINKADGATELGTQTVETNASGQVTSVTTN